MQCRLTSWHLWNDPVALREQALQRPIRYLQCLFLARRQPRALEVQNVHSECGGAQCNLAADLPQPNDPDRAAVEAAHSGDAAKVCPRHMSAVEGSVWQFLSRELLDADQPVTRSIGRSRGGLRREGCPGPGD